jgi:hypothetical protein
MKRGWENDARNLSVNHGGHSDGVAVSDRRRANGIGTAFIGCNDLGFKFAANLKDKAVSKIKCDECHKFKEGDVFTYPGGSIAQLCIRCAQDCGFDLETRELIDITEDKYSRGLGFPGQDYGE